MNRLIFFAFALFLLSASSLEAQRYCCWRRAYCCGSRCYMDPTNANYDALYYGYVDNINYPDTYHLPLNCCFNYCPPCRSQRANYAYLRNCMRSSNQRP